MLKLLHTLLAIILIGVSHAHQIAEMTLEIEASENRFLATIQADAAYMLPEFRGDEDLAAQDLAWLRTRSLEEWTRIQKETKTYLRQSLRFLSESGDLEWSISLPDFVSTPPRFVNDGIPEMPPMIEIRLEGALVDQELQIAWEEPYGVVLIVQSEGGVTPIISGETETIFRRPSLSEAPVSVPSSLGHWVQVGFHHILPTGLDHILFILGIFFLNPKWKSLLGKSLIFTLTHSITLGLAMVGWVSLPQLPVEILIAASILWVGIENLRLQEPKQADLWIIAGFGLIHGLGFASQLHGLIPDNQPGQLLPALIGFNAGVELGQLAVLLPAFALFSWWPEPAFKKLRLVAAATISLIVVFWIIERMTGS